MKPTQRFTTLDSFRGICALLVVFFHLHVVGAFIEFAFFRRAEILINFFFVLSGFVLAHTYGMKPHLNVKSFVISRAFRLLPLHILMLGVFIAFELVRWVAYERGLTLNNEPFTGLFAPREILPNLLLLQAWTPLTETMSFNYPSWSISIEFYIYMLFGALCLFSLKSRFLLCALVSLLCFGLIISGSHLLMERALLGLSCYFAGNIAYLAYLYIRDKFEASRLVMTVLECAMMYATYWIVMHDIPYRSPSASVLFCGLVILFAFEAGWVSSLLKTSVFLLLGKLSYSIYMTHAALLFCLSTVFIVVQKVTGLAVSPMIQGQRFMDTGSVLGNNLMVLAVVGAALVLAWYAHHLVELKGYEWGKRVIGKPKAKGVDAAPVIATGEPQPNRAL